MSSLRDVNNNDILKKWYIGMEEMYLGIINVQDKENDLETDELFDKLLNSIPKNNRKFVQNQFELIYDEFMRYVTYTNEKYYRNGFCDGVEIVAGSLGNS